MTEVGAIGSQGFSLGSRPNGGKGDGWQRCFKVFAVPVFRYISLPGELKVASKYELSASRSFPGQAGSLPYEKYEQVET
jgi:hypothetical protein